MSSLNNDAVLAPPSEPDNDDDGHDDDDSDDGVWSGATNSPRLPKTEVQNDFLGGPSVISGDVVAGESPLMPDSGNIAVMTSAFAGAQVLLAADTLSEGGHSGHDSSGLPLLPVESSLSSVAFANTGLEPVTDIWAISALQDDIEHLQDMAYRLVYELAEAMGCEGDVYEDKRAGAAGFSASEHGGEFALFLAGLSGQLSDKQFNMFMFCLNFSVLSLQAIRLFLMMCTW